MFVSYAQNFEDVMLARALRGVDRGFYVDVGAWSPLTDSVTKAFYDQGWRGINIEPNPQRFQELRGERTRDVNLAVAIQRDRAQVPFWLVADTGLSTAEEALARAHHEKGFETSQISVDAMPLDAVFAAHVPETQDVHFLKVDVEGSETEVLLSLDWTRHRPWIVVVEAMRPSEQVPNHEAWEPILLENRYRFVYADGLNRFYLAEERQELAQAFRYPPNVFDGFIMANGTGACPGEGVRIQRAVLEQANRQLARALGLIEQQNRQLLEKVASLERALAHPRSDPAGHSLLQEASSLPMEAAAAAMRSSPRLRRTLSRAVKRSPRLYSYLNEMALAQGIRVDTGHERESASQGRDDPSARTTIAHPIEDGAGAEALHPRVARLLERIEEAARRGRKQSA